MNNKRTIIIILVALSTAILANTTPDVSRSPVATPTPTVAAPPDLPVWIAPPTRPDYPTIPPGRPGPTPNPALRGLH